MKFEIVSKPNLHTIGYEGKGTIHYSVEGWERDEGVKIDVKRDRNWSTDKIDWQVDVQYPRWGRTKEIDVGVANENLMACLQEVVPLVKSIRTSHAILEESFQKGEADRKEAQMKAEAEAKALRDADQPVGAKLAKQIITHMITTARNSEQRYKEFEIKMFTRGKRSEQTLRVHYTGGLTLFNLGWSRISKKKALSFLEDSAIDALKVDGIQFVDPKVAKFLLGEKNG